MNKTEITIAVAGNPNSGKTTIFNLITGLNHKVGNYPGVTVEKIEGKIEYKGLFITFIDLPGIYSLNASSEDEIVARNFIINEKPDLILNILDSSNLERNLYLTTQLLEMKTPIILVFNMSDVAKGKGLEFNINQLSNGFSADIVNAVGHKGIGKDEILNTIYNNVTNKHDKYLPNIHYGEDIEKEIEDIANLLKKENDFKDNENLKWISLKLLENDKEINEKFNNSFINEHIERARLKIEKLYHDVPEIVIADKRYGFISGVCHGAIKNIVEWRHSVSDKIDEIVMNRFFGLPIFLFTMYFIFQMTFTFGSYPMELIENFFTLSQDFILKVWPESQFTLLRALIVEGIIGGVGGVIVFLPNIIFLFLGIALLEDSGYMARAAYVLDKWMQKVGLHGKSFIPMLIGFGCTVPAIMATRIIEDRKERIMTMLILPLMSCGARFPIYALIIPAFFPAHLQGPILWGIYMFGIFIAFILIKFTMKTVLKRGDAEFIMELPPYRMPTTKAMTLHTWFRTWLYLKKAGTVILGFSILLWALTTFPLKKSGTNELSTVEYSFAGRIGKFIEPVIKPLGFDWKIGTALIGAMGAKEVFVSQMGIVFSIDNADEDNKTLREKLNKNYSPLQALSIILFCLISAPCMATIVITKKESGKWKWALLQFFGLTIIAYIICFLVFQIGTLLGF